MSVKRANWGQCLGHVSPYRTMKADRKKCCFSCFRSLVKYSLSLVLSVNWWPVSNDRSFNRKLVDRTFSLLRMHRSSNNHAPNSCAGLMTFLSVWRSELPMWTSSTQKLFCKEREASVPSMMHGVKLAKSTDSQKDTVRSAPPSNRGTPNFHGFCNSQPNGMGRRGDSFFLTIAFSGTNGTAVVVMMMMILD